MNIICIRCAWALCGSCWRTWPNPKNGEQVRCSCAHPVLTRRRKNP